MAKKYRQKTPAIVTCLNVNGLAVARTLGRKGVMVIGIHPNDEAPETRSRYVRELWYGDSTTLCDLLAERADRFDKPPVLFPITDDSVAAVANALDTLREHYVIPMARPHTVIRLLDKMGFDRVAREMNLPVPGTWIVGSPTELEAAATDVPYPCILKPQEKSAAYAASGTQKAYFLEDEASLRATYLSFYEAEPRVVLQRYVPGGDDEVYFCLATCDEQHHATATFVGRKLRQWRPHCGGTAACEPVNDPAIRQRLTESTVDFFRRVGMVGPCSMEFKRDPRNDTFYMIEPTVCRPDWQNAIADANGTPIVWHTYCDALGLATPKPKSPWLQRRWVHFGTDRLAAHDYRRRGELGRLAWLWSIRPPVRGAYFALDDPSPYLAILGAWLKQKLRLGGPS